MIAHSNSRSSHGSTRSSQRTASVTTSAASVIDEHDLVPRNPAPLRTLDDVRSQVSQEVAIHAIMKAEYIDGVRLGVRFVNSRTDDEDFLRQIADRLQLQLTLQSYIFIFAISRPSVGMAATPTSPLPISPVNEPRALSDFSQFTSASASSSTLLICSSSLEYRQRAKLLTSSKFIGRLIDAADDDTYSRWFASVIDLGATSYDEDALWDVVRKSAPAPIDPLAPPPHSKGIDEILSNARAKLQRITAEQAMDELTESQVGAPTFLVDIRPSEEREREGTIRGSLIVDRNMLEWRFDPRCPSRLVIADRYDLRIIVFCQDGMASSLAAHSLQQLGLLNATDIIGGYDFWKRAGLPIDFNQHSSHIPRSVGSLAGDVV